MCVFEWELRRDCLWSDHYSSLFNTALKAVLVGYLFCMLSWIALWTTAMLEMHFILLYFIPSCKSSDIHRFLQNTFRKPFKKSIMLFSNIAYQTWPTSPWPKAHCCHSRAPQRDLATLTVCFCHFHEICMISSAVGHMAESSWLSPVSYAEHYSLEITSPRGPNYQHAHSSIAVVACWATVFAPC